MHIMTDRGWQLLGGPMSPAPEPPVLGVIPTVGVHYMADDRDAIEKMMKETAKLRGDAEAYRDKQIYNAVRHSAGWGRERTL